MTTPTILIYLDRDGAVSGVTADQPVEFVVLEESLAGEAFPDDLIIDDGGMDYRYTNGDMAIVDAEQVEHIYARIKAHNEGESA